MSAAAIDIGSNTVRLLVVADDGTEITREATVTGLATGVDATGRIDEPGYRATLEVIERYAGTIVAVGATKVEAVATSASRDAANGADLMDDIASILGVRPRVIAGTDEAALAFAGATGALEGRPDALVIDIGGGSTEFTAGRGEPSYAVSIDVGSVRLTDRYVESRPVPREVVDAVRLACDRAFSAVDLPGKPQVAIGVAGTFTSLAAMALGLERYDRDRVDGSVLAATDVVELVGMLAGMTVAETAAIPSLEPSRARVIFAGAVVAERAMARCGLDTVTVSEHDLLDGLVARALRRRPAGYS